MMKYKILDLYACLGGNRYKWDSVLQEAELDYEITAVELDPELARMYQERFPHDKVVIADAHQYLLDHYKEFDFIWTSPPCPTHSKVRFTQKNQDFYIHEYPNMMLYQEIIFLQHHFKGKYVVENVTPYYEPLVPAKQRGRHLYWTNFNLPTDLKEQNTKGIMCGQTNDELSKLCRFHQIDLSSYKGKQSKTKIARNLVDFEAGRTILETALNIQRQENTKQTTLF